MTTSAEAHLVRVPAEELHRFTTECFIRVGVREEDAAIAANVLLESDLRGIESHGVPRLEEFYLNTIRQGRTNPRPDIRIVQETPCTATVDGDGGLGMIVGHRSMEIAIRKAAETGGKDAFEMRRRKYGF